MEKNGGIIGLIAKRMEWLNHRQTLVARNIANADTPNFVPQDLKESSFSNVLRGQNAKPATPARTHEAHFGPTTGSGEVRPSDRADLYEVAPSGNAVVLEQELMKMNEVQSQHSLMVNLYKKHLQFVRMVVHGSSR